jgi:hypothetical protein
MDARNPNATTLLPDLTTVVTGLLSGMAFLVGNERTAEAPPGCTWLQGEIPYSGRQRGALYCWCTRDFAIQLAGSLLGIEPDESNVQASAEDAVRELMTVLHRLVVLASTGDDEASVPSIPTVRECDDVPWPPVGANIDLCRLSVGGEPLYCVHRINASK